MYSKCGNKLPGNEKGVQCPQVLHVGDQLDKVPL